MRIFIIFNFNSVAIWLEIDPVYPNIVFILENTSGHTHTHTHTHTHLILLVIVIHMQNLIDLFS